MSGLSKKLYDTIPETLAVMGIGLCLSTLVLPNLGQSTIRLSPEEMQDQLIVHRLPTDLAKLASVKYINAPSPYYERTILGDLQVGAPSIITVESYGGRSQPRHLYRFSDLPGFIFSSPALSKDLLSEFREKGGTLHIRDRGSVPLNPPVEDDIIWVHSISFENL